MIAQVNPEDTIISDETGSYMLPTPAGMLTDPRFLLAAIAWRVGTDGEATVVLDNPVDWSTVDESSGWSPHRYQLGDHWRAFVKDGTRINILTLADMEEGANDSLVLQAAAEFPQADGVASRLTAWWRATGTHYYATPGVAALINLRRSWGSAPQPQWRLIDRQSFLPWKPPATVEAIDFKAKGFNQRNGPWWKWDMRAAYLAAMAAVNLPFRQLKPTGTDPSTLECGYYRIPAADAPVPGWMLPSPDRQDTVWVCQGTLGMITDRAGRIPRIVDSWTPRTDGLTGYRRMLRYWAEDWRDLTLADPAPIKQGYAQLVGLMNVPSGQIYRPDWRHMIIDQQRASLSRRILNVEAKTGMWPHRVQVDAVYYRAASHDQNILGELLGVGDRIGNMRFEGGVA